MWSKLFNTTARSSISAKTVAPPRGLWEYGAAADITKLEMTCAVHGRFHYLFDGRGVSEGGP